MGITELVATSRKYGRDEEFVLAGGGNTSYKDETILYIKPSGTTLAEITEEGMVRLNRSKLDEIWHKKYSADPKERERQALADLMEARVEGESRRPSVETLLHELLRQRYVVHLHPSLVNGLTCGRDGRKIADELFHGRMLWIPVVNPGYVLASHIRDAINSRLAAGEGYPDVLFLQNHGVFVASDSLQEIERIYSDLMGQLSDRLRRRPDLSVDGASPALLTATAKSVAEAYERVGIPGELMHRELVNAEVRRIVTSETAFDLLKSFGYTPDHLVYCGRAPLWVPASSGSPNRTEDVEARVRHFLEQYTVAPRIVAVEGAGVITVANSAAALSNAEALFLDLVKLVTYAESFGGPQRMPEDKIEFILNWEVESYRTKVSTGEE